jgi:hypothetical protein
MIKKIQKKVEIYLDRKPLAVAIWSFLIVAIICIIIALIILIPNARSFKEYFNLTKTGPLGDTFNGLLGPFITFLVAILTFLAFYIQYKANEIQSDSNKIMQFENKFYELIKLHRENITELRYSKFHNGRIEIAESRKVFRVIAKEFIDCLHELKRITRIYPEYEILLPIYKQKLEKIKFKNKCRADIEELALIDIAFCFIYFGISKESDTVLLNLFYNRYNREFIYRAKKILRLKPKEEGKESFILWGTFHKKQVAETRELFDEIYKCQNDYDASNLSEEAYQLYGNFSLEPYYGGHQHRLGHYFRHLFQSYKFLSSQVIIKEQERYFYGKTLRAQLSTYEQFLLFVNSLSSLGMKWEYTVEKEDLFETQNKTLFDFKFITRYNLIKNMPGSQYYEIIYRKFYPSVNFEYRDDISYK